MQLRVETEAAVELELQRITDVKQNASGFASYQQWLSRTRLEQRMSIEEYLVSNRGLRSGLAGTPDKVQDQLGEFKKAGVDLVLLQFGPQYEEMERFGETVISEVVQAEAWRSTARTSSANSLEALCERL